MGEKSVYERVVDVMHDVHGTNPLHIFRGSQLASDLGYDFCMLLEVAEALDVEFGLALFVVDIEVVARVHGLVSLVERELARLETAEGIPGL